MPLLVSAPAFSAGAGASGLRGGGGGGGPPGPPPDPGGRGRPPPGVGRSTVRSPPPIGPPHASVVSRKFLCILRAYPIVGRDGGAQTWPFPGQAPPTKANGRID